MPKSLQRTLRLRNGTGFEDVVVSIFWLEQRDQSWFSGWTIGWPERERRGSAGGADAIQALFVALNMVGTGLYCSAEHKAGLLSWPMTGPAKAFRRRGACAMH